MRFNYLTLGFLAAIIISKLTVGDTTFTSLGFPIIIFVLIGASTLLKELGYD